MKAIILASVVFAASLSAASAAQTTSFPTGAPCFGPLCHSSRTSSSSLGAKVAGAAGAPSLANVLTSIFNHGTSAILTDMASADSVAGQVDPNSPYAAPYNLYQYNAHMCISAAMPWLESASGGSATVPTPTGSGGILTNLVVAEVGVSTAQEFVNKLVGNGIPPAVTFNCAAWGQQIVKTPAAIAANANADFVNLLKAFAQ